MSQQTIDFDANPPMAIKDYDSMARMALPGYEAMHAMALACLRSRLSAVPFGQSHLPVTANLLVVGAGTGMELVRFGNANLQWQMLGVDPSANMLAIAQEKIEQQGLSERIKLFPGYTQDLPTTALYDAATCILVMHFVPDDGSKLALLQSIAQRLHPSAVFILVDVFGEKGSHELNQMISIITAFWEDMGIPQEKRMELLETFNEAVYPISETRVRELLQQAGLGNVMRFYTGLWVGGWIATKN